MDKPRALPDPAVRPPERLEVDLGSASESGSGPGLEAGSGPGSESGTGAGSGSGPGRVVLRRYTSADVTALHAAIVASVEELKPWMPWAVEPVRVEEQAAFLESDAEAWATGGTSLNYGIFDAADGSFVGGVGVHDRNGPGVLEIGYWLDTRRSGRGVMTRVVEDLGARLFELPGIERIEIHCDAANARSAAVPKRLGYRLDHYEERVIEAPGETGRHMIWVLDRPAVD